MRNKTNLRLSSYSFLILVFSLIVVGTGTSCKKDHTCTAHIKVVDHLGTPVAGATVVLYKTGITQYNGTPANVSDTKITDLNGETTHVFPNPSVLDISVSFNNRTSSEVIRLEEGKTIEKTVTLD